MSTHETTVVTDERFPHGLRCATCDRIIESGQPFSHTVGGVYDNGDTHSTIACVYCGGAS